MRHHWIPVLVVSCGLAAGGCGEGPGRAGRAADGAGPVSGPLVVFAASSLTEPFEDLGRMFEAEHAGVTVTFNFAASTALARQINEGGRADVFASADDRSMRTVIAAGNTDQPVVIARNRLAILVEKDNPKRITRLADLATPGIVLVLCAPQVPCGRLAGAALRRAGVAPEVASLEDDVKAVVSKVTLGEADAGMVYRSDVQAAGDRAEGIDIEGADGLEAVYPMAVTTASANRVTAGAWVDLVRSSRARTVLRAAGFLAP